MADLMLFDFEELAEVQTDCNPALSRESVNDQELFHVSEIEEINGWID